MSNGKVGDLSALALGYVQRKEIPADLPVKTTDDVDQGGGGGRKQVSSCDAHHLFVLSSRFGPGRLELFASLIFSLILSRSPWAHPVAHPGTYLRRGCAQTLPLSLTVPSCSPAIAPSQRSRRSPSCSSPRQPIKPYPPSTAFH